MNILIFNACRSTSNSFEGSRKKVSHFCRVQRQLTQGIHLDSLRSILAKAIEGIVNLTDRTVSFC